MRTLEIWGKIERTASEFRCTSYLHRDASWWSSFSIAGGQKLAMSQITDDLGHERVWNLGEKKEDDEGVPFYLLFAPRMHHGSRAHLWLADRSSV